MRAAPPWRLHRARSLPSWSRAYKLRIHSPGRCCRSLTSPACGSACTRSSSRTARAATLRASTRRMVGYRQAGCLGMYDELDFICPVLYHRFGVADADPATIRQWVARSTRQAIEGSLELPAVMVGGSRSFPSSASGSSTADPRATEAPRCPTRWRSSSRGAAVHRDLRHPVLVGLADEARDGIGARTGRADQPHRVPGAGRLAAVAKMRLTTSDRPATTSA